MVRRSGDTISHKQVLEHSGRAIRDGQLQDSFKSLTASLDAGVDVPPDSFAVAAEGDDSMQQMPNAHFTQSGSHPASSNNSPRSIGGTTDVSMESGNTDAVVRLVGSTRDQTASGCPLSACELEHPTDMGHKIRFVRCVKNEISQSLFALFISVFLPFIFVGL